MAMTKGAPLIYTPKFAYVANSGSNNVSAYTIDAGTPPTPGTGALTPVAGSPFAAGTTPKSVGVDPFGRFAYVANGGGNVSAYTINPSTGALTHVGTDIAAGTSPASVSVGPSGRFAYVANAGDGINPSTVSAYSIDAGTGSLTHVGTDAATGISPASVTVHPTGRFAYVANSGSNDVSAYSINPSSGVLTQIDSDSVAVGIQNFAAGTSPKSVSVDPTGRFAYVANGDGTVSSFRIDPPSGALILPGSVSAGTNPASVAVEPSGKFAYVARGDGNVSVHAIDAVPGGSGALASASSTTAAGTSPVSVTVDASGQFAYVANSGSANVSAYKVNSGGSLSAVSGSPFGAGSAPSSVTTTGTIQ
jgi:6-phosphogluconolactonase (cycloisomerase 2 family)